MTKSEFKKIINNSIKEKRKGERRGSSTSHYNILSNNKDSIFFKTKKVEIFTSQAAARQKGLCRTIELEFLKNRQIIFYDSQSCNEPSSGLIPTRKNLYKYKIKQINKQLYIYFKNSFNEMKFKVVSASRKLLNGKNYYEIEMERIK
ncbi:hypothetical protein [uncultured Psychroserpens sp.]|uniref:hypothetical protein n=1 Tax=uncultured Psychroserpens sp. TaxID=255436 RepID=UPI002605DCF5|nr:hypothetical protein [uncultured Psychroserpens sp.]